ncbi:MAG TPA: ATP-binding cassette domain-containing protein [Bacteroidales bacterium]|nr:ATP-binding cassette domain-containing protein [Bacteroidales bacterium]
MSEEILRALMQLFAIISKQDEGTTDHQRTFVESFLASQLNKEKVNEYLSLYDEKAAKDESKDKKAGVRSGKLTAMKDSVKTLAICRKINKTLSQKQKVVVLIRIFELLKSENLYTEQRMGIIETVSTVFNIANDELELISNFIRYDEGDKLDFESILRVRSEEQQEEFTFEKSKEVLTSSLDGVIYFMKVKSVDLYFMKYKGTSEINLNGLAFNQNNIYLFPPGSTLRLPKGTLYYSDIVSRYIKDENLDSVSFKAEDISFRFPGGKYGLRDVNIAEEFGLVGIMGASGSGKTTLMNVLSGIEKPYTGQVSVNGLDVHKNATEAKALIGYIAQDDFLFEDLTVYENLYYSAKLCFKNKTEEEIVERVNTTLNNLGLFEIKDIKVGSPMNKKISGGQRKRLNIALELIREPSVLFVDEPTSGLSSKDSENVMDLLKELSLNMKLIFVVIHQPSSDIFKMFDRLFIMDTGGFPIYYDNPVESLVYFKTITNQINADVGECQLCGNVNPEMLFNIIEAKEVDDFGRFTRNRLKSPQDWHELFLKKFKKRVIEEYKAAEEKVLEIPSKIKQFGIFIRRDVMSKMSNAQYLAINLLETPLLAFLLTIIIKYNSGPDGSYIFMENENIPPYIFMSIVIALFVGLSVSAEEIFRDRKILKREAFLNLSRSSYLLSKVAILFVLSAYQTIAFVLIGNSILEIKGLFLEYWLMLFATACFANMLGLNISSAFNSAVTIYILIPLLVIPQMILGGAMFSFDKLNDVIGGDERKAPVIADFMTSRWAYEALAVTQYKDNPYQEELYELEKLESQINFKTAYLLPELENLLKDCEEVINGTREKDPGKFSSDLKVLKNSLMDEQTTLKTDVKVAESLFDPNNFDNEDVNHIYNFIEEVKDKYLSAFSRVNDMKNQKISQLEEQMGAAEFTELKKDNYNEFLSALVKKETVSTKILRSGDEFVQVVDPIYQDPDPTELSLRAHFYAPEKYVLNSQISTLGFNLGVIWLFTIIFYVLLYYDVLKKLLNISINPDKNK